MSFLERIELSLLSDDGKDNKLSQGHSDEHNLDRFNTHDDSTEIDPKSAKYNNNVL